MSTAFPACRKCGQEAVCPASLEAIEGVPDEVLPGVAPHLKCAACGDTFKSLNGALVAQAARAAWFFRERTKTTIEEFWVQKIEDERKKVERLKKGRW